MHKTTALHYADIEEENIFKLLSVDTPDKHPLEILLAIKQYIASNDP